MKGGNNRKIYFPIAINKMTIIYLIRHSVRLPLDNIESYHTNQDKLVLNEKIILSPLGEERARLLSEKDELQNIDVVYTSNCVRTIATAKYLMMRQNLKANIDDRLDERRIGKPNVDLYPDWFSRQYFDETFKTDGGESQKEVRERVNEVIKEILTKHENKRVAIFSHGYAITFYLLKYCNLVSIIEGKLKYEFNNKIIFEKRISAPEVFKLSFEKNNIKNIELIEFDDIPYNHGV